MVSMNLGSKFNLLLGTVLFIAMAFATLAFIAIEKRYLLQQVETDARLTLDILSALHVQSMRNRQDDGEGGPVIQTLNGTLDTLGQRLQTTQLWLVMSEKVMAFQRSRQHPELEPPRDDIDREALTSTKPVSRFLDGDRYRLSIPMIMGVGDAADPACAGCHTTGMGILDGEVIGAFSILVDTGDVREKIVATAWLSSLLALSVCAVVTLAGSWLVQRMASGPLRRLTAVMTALAGGDLKVEIPDRNRRDELGSMAGALAVFRQNARERAANERQVDEHRQALALVQRRVTLGEIASTLAHELKQPLSAIVNYCDALLLVMQAGTDTRERSTDIVRQMSSQAARAVRITDGIHQQAKGGCSDMAPADMRGIIAAVRPLIEPVARSGEVRIDWLVDEALPPVRINRPEIESVLLNLLRNAIDALCSAGCVTGQRLIEVRASGESGNVCVVVRDNGPGLTPDGEHRLFDAFYTTKTAGLGMGLAICRSIVEAHQGRLELLHDHRPGAAFRFCIPAEPEQT